MSPDFTAAADILRGRQPDLAVVVGEPEGNGGRTADFCRVLGDVPLLAVSEDNIDAFLESIFRQRALRSSNKEESACILEGLLNSSVERRAHRNAVNDLELEIAAYFSCMKTVLDQKDFKDVAVTIYNTCKRLMGAGMGGVSLLASDGLYHEPCVLDSGDSDCFVDSAVLMPVQGLCTLVYEEKRAMFVNDFAQSPWAAFVPPGHPVICNVLFAPIVINGKTYGLLGLANKPGGFSENDKRVASIFGEAAAIALEKTRSWAAARKAGKDWENIFQAIGHSAMILDENQIILEANKSTASMFNLPVNAIVGKKCHELFHGTNAPPPGCPFFELKNSGFAFTATSEMQSMCGPHLVSVTPVLDENGKVEKIIHIATNLNAYRNIEIELGETRAQYQHLIETMPSGVMAFKALNDGLDFKIADMNRAAETITGVKREDATGRSLTDLFRGVSGSGILALLQNAYRSGKDGYLPMAHYKDRVLDIWVTIRVYPLPDGRVVVVFDDITEKVAAEKLKMELEGQLVHQQKLESIGILAGGVAHEINNPILGIMNYARIMEDELDPQSSLAFMAREIGVECKRVADIVQNLLTFARQDKLVKAPCSLADIIDSTLKLVRTLFRQDQITLLVDIPDDLPPVTCRSQQIQQALLNILTNARDALNGKYQGYHPEKMIKVSASQIENEGGRFLRVSLEDRGCGIDPAIRECIFDPFFTTKRDEAGTGLGLSISHGILRDHQGRLWVESEPGSFSRFHVELPV